MTPDTSPTTARPRRPRRPSGDAVPGLPARRAALRMVDAVLNRGEPLDVVAHAAAQGLAPPDRALAIAIATEAMRWTIDADAMIDRATTTPLPPDAKARRVLMLAIVQEQRLGTPGHAVVATALALLDGGPRRLAHAVLSRIGREGWRLPDTPTLPPAAADRWRAQWGEAMVAAASRAMAAPPALDLSLKVDAPGDADPGGEPLSLRHRRLPRGTGIRDVPGFEAGAWWVQDIAASLAVRLAGDGAGRTAIDLCAAPGGKTMQLAAAGFAVTALDLSQRRSERLAANLSRTGLPATIVTGDAKHWRAPARPDGSPARFDVVLLDAPCSATGIYRRHPDVLHRVDDAIIAATAALQTQLLDNAAALTRAGGTLIYATCSLERAEGEDQLALFLATHPGWTVDPARAEELPAGITVQADGTIRTLPPTLEAAGGCDGFYIARLRAPG